MYYSYSECRNCEVYGYCSGTEEEHQAYMENFAWHEAPMASDCESCISLSYCTKVMRNVKLLNHFRSSGKV